MFFGLLSYLALTALAITMTALSVITLMCMEDLVGCCRFTRNPFFVGAAAIAMLLDWIITLNGVYSQTYEIAIFGLLLGSLLSNYLVLVAAGCHSYDVGHRATRPQ